MRRVVLGAMGVVLSLHVFAAERCVGEGEQASFSPDGRSLVYQRLTGGRFGVFVRDLDKGEERRLSPEGVDAIQPEWSRDGRIVWTEGHETKTAFAARHDSTGWNLVEVDAAGQRRELTHGRHRLYAPTYGRDGKIYFSSEIIKPENGSTDWAAGNRSGIGVLTGKEPGWYRKVTVLNLSNSGVTDAHFSSDWLVRSEVAHYTEPWRIVISPIDRPESRTYLTGLDMAGVSPAISPDGRQVAFAGCREGDDGWQIYLVRVGDRLPTSLPEMRKIASGENPAFAPDGKRIAFDRGGKIYITDADGEATFEKIALVDGSDFATIFDVETRDGIRQTLEHVALTGADTMLWRTHSGAMPRYRSEAENPCRLDHPIDTRRLPNRSTIHSWMKLWREGEDPLGWVFEETAKIPTYKYRGFHTLMEEAHYQFQYLGEWNLNHPQYWCRKANGTVQIYHSSFAYPEVREHRLAIVRELLKRAPDVLYYDTLRNGGYSPANDYVRPNLEEWARRYPNVPVPKGGAEAGWADWVNLCAESQYRYFAEIRRMIAELGQKTRFIVNVEELQEQCRSKSARLWGIDWRELIRRKLVDAIAVTSIAVNPEDPFNSAERIVRDFLSEAKGRSKIYMPIMNYNFSITRPSYGQLAAWEDIREEESVRRLLALYDKYGADGIIMECVDYRNYSPAVCKAIREYRRGDWRTFKPAPAKPVAEVLAVKLRSASMKKEIPLTVMVPSDYASGNRRYPVAYLLHGVGNDERAYAVKQLRAAAEKYGVIVVAPYGAKTWWIDAPEVPRWKYETMVVRELVPWMDANYRTRATCEGRLIAGHSMGGYGACWIGLRHRELFSTVGNVMGDVDIEAYADRADLQKVLGPLTANPQRWRDYSILTEAAKLKDGDIKLISIIGKDDPLVKSNRKLHELLQRNGVGHQHVERAGGHTRGFAHRALVEVLKRFAESAQ